MKQKNWKTVKLKSISEYIQRGKSPKYTDLSELPVVNQKCVRLNGIDRAHLKYVHPDQFPNWNEERYLKDGDLLWNSTGTGTIGRACLYQQTRVNEKIVVDSHVTIVRPNKELASKYLFYWINGPVIQGKVIAMQAGSTNQVELSKSAIEDTIIPLPPLLEQHRIAAILDKADGLRRKRAETIKLLDQFLRSVFLEMFGDPNTNPKGWQKHKLNQIGTLDRGKSKHRPRNAPELLGGAYPLVQTGDVANCGGYITKYEQRYSELGLKQSRMWPRGTLCITIAANIAKTGILNFDACFPDSIVGFTPSKNVRTEYVQFWLSFLQKKLEETAPESAQKNINLRILRNLDVPLPPLDLQNKFISVVMRNKKIKENMEHETAELGLLFNSLAQRAFRGEL